MPVFVRARSICLAVLMAIAASAWAAETEIVDSGWSVARPAIDAHPQPSTPQMRVLLDQVLRSTEGGLRTLHQESPTSPATVHVADREGVTKGWRAAAASPVSVGSGHPSATPAKLENVARPADDRTPASETLDALGSNLEFGQPFDGRNDSNAAVGTEDAVPGGPDALAFGNSTTALAGGGISANRSRPIGNGPSTAGESVEEEHDTRATSDPVEEYGDTDAAADTEVVEDRVEPAPPDAAPAVPPKPLTQQLTYLRSRLRAVLRGYYQKPLNSVDNDPWEVMHGMLAFGIHSRVRQGGPRGTPITSVGWLCYNRPCDGKSLLYVTPEEELRAKHGVGLQGHMGQLLAMLAQCRVSPDYPIRVGNQAFTIHDLIEAEKKTCYTKSELTFKLIGLSTYCDLDSTWVNDQGLDWDFPKLISEELAQPIRGAACGGTHRLSGLSLVVKARVKSGQPVDGEYATAAEFVKNYQNYAFRLQNRDGSLSTKWFQGSGDESDLDRRIKTTGHILEWLIYSLSDEELRDQRTIRAVTYLTNLMYSNYDHEWEVGPVSHATHALLLYDERVFSPFDADSQPPFANVGGSRGQAPRGSGRR